MTAPLPQASAPSYITVQHHTYDLPRPEVVGLTEQERRQFTRHEVAPRGRALLPDLLRPVARLVDLLIVDPLRMLFANVGFLVTGVLTIAAVTWVANLLLSAMLAPFR